MNCILSKGQEVKVIPAIYSVVLQGKIFVKTKKNTIMNKYNPSDDLEHTQREVNYTRQYSRRKCLMSSMSTNKNTCSRCGPDEFVSL